VTGWFALALYAGMLSALYVVARRRNAAISLRTPVSMALCVLGACVIALCMLRGIPVSYGVALSFACVVVCSASDLATGLIFDAVTGAAACSIALWSLIVQGAQLALLGSCICIAPLLLLHVVTRGRGIGLGDVKLGGIIGAGVGGVEAVGAIGVAFIAGAVFCIPQLLMRRVRRDDRVAFAPFMALGTIAIIAGRLVVGHV
jgi:prepilin signal peptidase PulO-like enzyme (type II secretory pathway)